MTDLRGHRQKNRRPKETLRPTPDRVREIVVMFADTIREIRPDLAEGDVTRVVNNYTWRARAGSRHSASA